jgi:hypothetical protein
VVDLSVAEGKLVLHVRGMDQFWALKSTLEIPLEHVTGIRTDSEVARGWWHGIKLMGAELPGVLTAGTFYHDGQKIFWDVHHPDKTIVIELNHEKYGELIVEVANPNAAVSLVQSWLPRG